jgi:hypothetical protein
MIKTERTLKLELIKNYFDNLSREQIKYVLQQMGLWKITMNLYTKHDLVYKIFIKEPHRYTLADAKHIVNSFDKILAGNGI